jgi:hypothetical protein
VERWAKFVRENPDKWQDIHTEFINAQFQMHEDFVNRLLETPGGKEKLEKWREWRKNRQESSKS